jgi:uncharacterized protein YcgL (UPF0745 family)
MRPCDVYRSDRHEGMYLYVDRERGLAEVPEALLARFGPPQLALTLALSPERRLARVDAGEVLREIDSNGYFLQLPPRPAAAAQR